MTGFLARRGLRLGPTGYLLAGAVTGTAWALAVCVVAYFLP